MASNFSNFYNTLNIANNSSDDVNTEEKTAKTEKTDAGDIKNNTVSGPVDKDNNKDDNNNNQKNTDQNNQKSNKNKDISPLKADIAIYDKKKLILNKKLQDKQNNPEITEVMAGNNDIGPKILTKKVFKPIWLSVSESAKLGGVAQKTIRRAITAKQLKYKIVKDRYLIDLASVITFMTTNTKLKNKLNFNGIGQYVDIWRG